KFSRFQEPIVFLFHDVVTLTRSLGQGLTIQNADLPTPVANQSRLLEDTGCHRNAGSSYAQHLREKFLSQWNFIRIDDFAANQQPSTKARFQCMEPIAKRRLRNLRQN